MSELQVTARCAIHDGQLDAFKSAAEACMESTRTKDSGTLQYDWFFNEDHTECVVRERYTSSEAVLEHVGNLGDLFGNLMGVSDITFEFYGRPSDALMEAVSGLDVTVYHPYH